MPRRSQHSNRTRSTSPEEPSVWIQLIASDLELIWNVQDMVRAWPVWMQVNLARAISHHPLRDVSIITWFAFLLGCHRFGFHFFWACCINLVGAAFLRLLLSAPRPFMYDQRLRPLTDRYETSHGLPSLETHMATVVAGWWAESGGGKGSIDSGGESGVQPVVRLLAVAYICFVGFTRVYACSRFVHQVVLSMVTGTVGLAWGWRLATHLDGLGLMMRHHVRGTAVVLIVALGMLAYQVENNESQMMGIKKKEYLRVLSNIVKKSREAQSASVGAPDGNGADDGEWIIRDGAPWDGRTTSAINRRRRLEDRRDSFHFLQKAVEGRAQQKASRNPGTNNSQAVSPGPQAWGVPWEGMAGVGEFERREAREPRNPRSGGEERFFAAAERAWGSSLG